MIFQWIIIIAEKIAENKLPKRFNNKLDKMQYVRVYVKPSQTACNPTGNSDNNNDWNYFRILKLRFFHFLNIHLHS